MSVLTDEQRLVQEMARTFAREVLAPGAAARAKAKAIEPAVLAQMGELGFFGMTVPEEMGGVGADYMSYALALIEIAAGDGAVSTVMSVHNAPSTRSSSGSRAPRSARGCCGRRHRAPSSAPSP